jgi:PAS domain S-box-containing protein
MSGPAQIIRKLWPSSLRGKLILGVAFVHLLLMTIFVFDFAVRQSKFLKKQNHEQASHFVNDLAVNSTPYIIANDFDQLERFTLYHTNFPHLKYAMILSPDGIVLAHTNADYVGKRPNDAISLQLTRFTTGKTLIEDDHILDMAIPIFVDKKIVGWARVGIGQDYIQNNLATIVRDGIFYIIAALLIGAAFAILIGNRLTKGLYQLISIARRIRAGDRNIRAPEFNHIELSDLANALNQMLDQISSDEKLLSMVVENMPVGVWILNEKGKIISANSAGREIWGGTHYVDINEFNIYKGWLTSTKELIKPEQWPATLAITKGKTTLNEEVEIEAFDGRRKIILNSALPLLGKEGQIIGAVGINVDITERKQTLERLALSESTFRSAFDSSAIGMAIVSPEGKFLRVNRELCRMLGYTEDELLLLTAQTITYPYNVEQNRIYREQILNGEIDNFHMDKKYVHKNGTLIWAQLSASLVRDSQNKPLFFVTQIEDITESKKITEQLILSESIFRSAFDYSAIGMALVAAEGKFIRVNRELCRMLGYSEQEFSSLTFQTITYPYNVEQNRRYLEQILNGEIDNFHMDKKYIHKNGTIVWTHLSTSLVRDNENKPMFFVSQIEDLTESKNITEQLILSESIFRNAFDYSSIGMTLVLPDGKFSSVNKSLCRMVGYSEQELLSLTFQDITHPDDLETDLAFLHQTLKGKIDSYQMDKRYFRKDGTIIWVQLSVSLVRGHDQKPLFFISQIEDISERKKADELEREINKAVTDAQENERQQISMELHDNVKQIMAGCLLHMDLIKMYVKDEKVSPIIDNVRDYIRETIEELRRISHQLAPSVDLSIPLEEKIRTVVNTMNVTNAVEVHYDFNIKDQALKADAQLTLFRIVQEQFANILKHAKASVVEIIVKKCDGDVTMTITDDGIGFDNRVPKNGIGLENIKRRVQILNGKFNIQTTPGNGCRLFIQLPGN